LILGFGGSLGFAAPAKQFSFAYVMNRMGAETTTDIDPRYKAMLNQIETMLNRSNVAGVGKNLSFYLAFCCIVLFYIKPIID
jgi:hypothetical protein